MCRSGSFINKKFDKKRRMGNKQKKFLSGNNNKKSDIKMQKRDIEKQKKYIIAKHKHLIDASYLLSPREFKIVAAMISKIHPDDDDFHMYRFSVPELAQIIGVKKDGFYSEIKKLMASLIRRVVTLKKEKGALQISWVSSAEYFFEEGMIEISFDPKLKPYLLHLKDKIFTGYRFGSIMNLSSAYSCRLFELLMSTYPRHEFVMTVEELREKMSIGKTKYKRWAEFRRNVIEKALLEIDKQTDLQILNWMPVKVGRRVDSVYITFKKKPISLESNKHKKEKAFTENLNTLISLLPEKHQDSKFIQDKLLLFLKKKGMEYAKKHISYANKNANRNYGRYLSKALTHGWAEDQKVLEEELLLSEKEKRQKEFKKMQLQTLFQQAMYTYYEINDLCTGKITSELSIKDVKTGEEYPFEDIVAHILENNAKFYPRLDLQAEEEDAVRKLAKKRA